ncbi:MAG: glycoside hydrolase family 15 protein, partial [Solirubrobacteraceae bacterium]
EPHVLREYALLADGERGILVGPRGDFAWMCFPRWHSEGILSTLIGGAGSYAVTPVARCVWGGHYEPGSLIWHGRWVCDDDAIVECREALALPARGDQAVVLRRVIACEGTARVRVELDPRAAFGAHALADLACEDGVWSGRCGDAHVQWAGAANAAPAPDGGLRASLELPAGAHHDLVLVLATDRPGERPPEPGRAWQATEDAWRERVPALRGTAADRDARHAYAVLSGLTSSGGGMVAAATTSLPERAGQGRSYDYRYVWVRDQCYAGQGVAAAGPHALMDDAVRFVSERLIADGPGLAPAYTIDGGAVPDERRIDLPGYPGGTGIVGNRVNGQFQLDAFGEALLLLAAAAGHDHVDRDAWTAAEAAAGAIAERWHEADAGVWEIDPDRWTHSRLICAAGLRLIAPHCPRAEQAAVWRSLADRITADTAARAVHASGRWQRSPGDERVDAALLLPALRGAVAPADPRSLATLRAVEADLEQDGYCYRYRPDERPLGASEGAFLLCGFWMALARRQQGDDVAAARWFERNRAACGPPGLCSEEFDVAQRQLRGNLPQAFVHALLLECAVALAG